MSLGILNIILPDFNNLASLSVKINGYKKGLFLSLISTGENKDALKVSLAKKGKGKFYWPFFLGIACPLVVYPLPFNLSFLSKYNTNLSSISRGEKKYF
jgi:hypothetical protein